MTKKFITSALTDIKGGVTIVVKPTDSSFKVCTITEAHAWVSDILTGFDDCEGCIYIKASLEELLNFFYSKGKSIGYDVTEASVIIVLYSYPSPFKKAKFLGRFRCIADTKGYYITTVDLPAG